MLFIHNQRRKKVKKFNIRISIRIHPLLKGGGCMLAI
jgi:hypothetical protein